MEKVNGNEFKTVVCISDGIYFNDDADNKGCSGDMN